MAAYKAEMLRLLAEAGIERETPRGEILLDLLISHCEEWRDRASAFGGDLEPARAAFISASAMAGDPGALERLERAGCRREAAADLLAHLRIVADRLAREGMDRPAPRRRWGEGSPPAIGAAWPWWHDQRHG